jgi:GDP/UDP-N,N'-diacetylbacillosamine 2-epimerase (hydrolysing)
VNVINAEFEENDIVKALEKAISPEFRAYLDEHCVNPYGDGKTTERILEIITNTAIDNKLIVKDITY